ncbi:Plasmodium vivax Vir protein, putative [Plasmodium vivax]|uniref:Vir protein, putative n=1 Tax=Plasmodium vivax TaxID=5855 RepID=A0A1G4EAK5_PLAVI|nr:Plasmodium vivax Vir protein, putative [Plasmodium vivax]
MGSTDVYKELKRSDFSFKDELYSEKFYDSLYNLKGLSGYFEYCSKLDKLQVGNNVKIICARLLKYLENNSFSRNEDNVNSYCLLLNYWVLSSLNNYLYLKYPSKLVPALGNIESIWTSFIEDNLNKLGNETCKPIQRIIMDTDWKDRKELYEYYVDYYQLSETVKIYTNMCEEFYEYVESKKKLYKHFDQLCASKDANRCPKYYAECKKYDPQNVLSNHNCHQKIMQKMSAAGPSVLQFTNRHLGSETDSGETDGPMKTFDPPKLSGKSQTVENVGNILLGVVATTMTSGALYRFTPLGGMIRNGLGWNNNNMRNFNGGDIGLYDYASGSFNPYPGEEHYIGYHPA